MIYSVIAMCLLTGTKITEQREMKLHVLTGDDALCLDGSPGAFYFSPGSASSKWLLWHEGKAWCLSDADCVARTKATDGRGGWKSSGWPEKEGCLPSSIPFQACPGQNTCQLSPDPKLNPAFHDHNMVFIKTCDGASFSGNRSSPVNISGNTIYYRGKCKSNCSQISHVVFVPF